MDVVEPHVLGDVVDDGYYAAVDDYALPVEGECVGFLVFAQVEVAS